MKKLNRIICFGASSTQGRGDPEFGGFFERLRKTWESENQLNMVFNLGISGQIISEMLNRFDPECRARNPHLIIHYLGFNDIARAPLRSSNNKTDLVEYKNNLIKLFTESKNICESLVILPLPFDEKRTAPYKNYNIYYLSDDAKRYINIQNEVATSLGLKVLDLFNSSNNQDQVHENNFLSEDGLHASATGHEYIYLNILKALKE